MSVEDLYVVGYCPKKCVRCPLPRGMQGRPAARPSTVQLPSPPYLPANPGKEMRATVLQNRLTYVSVASAGGGAGAYHFAFNGMEADDRISGEGNSYTTAFRQVDTRLGRWWSVDPASAMFPFESPYAGFGNNPIFFNDPSGLAPESGDKKKKKKNSGNGGGDAQDGGQTTNDDYYLDSDGNRMEVNVSEVVVTDQKSQEPVSTTDSPDSWEAQNNPDQADYYASPSQWVQENGNPSDHGYDVDNLPSSSSVYNHNEALLRREYMLDFEGRRAEASGDVMMGMGLLLAPVAAFEVGLVSAPMVLEMATATKSTYDAVSIYTFVQADMAMLKTFGSGGTLGAWLVQQTGRFDRSRAFQAASSRYPGLRSAMNQVQGALRNANFLGKSSQMSPRILTDVEMIWIAPELGGVKAAPGLGLKLYRTTP